jgi:hypothetical protein
MLLIRYLSLSFPLKNIFFLNNQKKKKERKKNWGVARTHSTAESKFD